MTETCPRCGSADVLKRPLVVTLTGRAHPRTCLSCGYRWTRIRIRAMAKRPLETIEKLIRTAGARP